MARRSSEAAETARRQTALNRFERETLRVRLQTLDTTRPVYVGSAISLVLGLFFIFVWSPLPFGWLGIDHYDDRAVRLAAGEPFDTTDVPWGYSYYLALFYVIFGPHAWIPLVFQAVVNASVPVLLYHLVRPLADQRTAALSGALAGIFSFNTVYAATQSSDAVCTVLFLTSLLLFDRGRRSHSVSAFAASGLLAGLAPQFRPNLILFPPLLALVYVVARPCGPRRLREAALYLAVVTAALVPWTVRNYRLTGDFLPTSTHGGYQLWLGTLEIGSYVERRPDNPRSLFEAPAFDYTSLEDRSLIVTAVAGECDPAPRLVYSTDRDRAPRVIKPRLGPARRVEFEIPGQPSPTAIYYYFDAQGSALGNEQRQLTPSKGPSDPLVFFVATDHLGDLDRHDDLLDIFDLVRLLRRQAWNGPVPDDGRWDLNGDSVIDEGDTRLAVQRLSANVDPRLSGDAVTSIQSTRDAVELRLVDGSTLRVPLVFGGKVTDLEAHGDLAGKLLYSRLSSRGLGERGSRPAGGQCGGIDEVTINEVFFRREPHWMRRHTALAMDNIRRDPGAFVTASLYRAFRLFVIRGSSDPKTSHQFTGSAVIYGVGMVVSSMVFAAFLLGVWTAWHRRARVLWLALPVVYVPITICFVLTNMRYTVTVQPLIFVFVAIALGTLAHNQSSSAD